MTNTDTGAVAYQVVERRITHTVRLEFAETIDFNGRSSSTGSRFRYRALSMKVEYVNDQEPAWRVTVVRLKADGSPGMVRDRLEAAFGMADAPDVVRRFDAIAEQLDPRKK